MKHLLGLTVLLLSISYLSAACPSVKAVRVQQQVIAAVVPVAAYVPTYGASYTATGETDALLRLLIEEVRALRAELRGKGAETPTPAATNGAQLFEQTCLKCHQTATANQQGGGFVLYEVDKDGKGQLAPLSLKEKERITRRIDNGTMPPVSFMQTSKLQLSSETKKTLVEWLTRNQNDK